MSWHERNRPVRGSIDENLVIPARGKEGTDWNAQKWLTVKEASAALGRTGSLLCGLIKQRKLSCFRTQSRPGKIWLPESEIRELILAHEDRLAQRLSYPKSNPQSWGSRQVPQPLPDGDEWISVKDAALILGVGRSTTLTIARQGLVPARQAREYRQGCRVELSRYFVSALAARRKCEKERVARDREEKRKEREARGEAVPKRRSGWSDGWQPVFNGPGMEALDLRSQSPATRKDRGQFYTVRQVALMLNVGVRRVRIMIASGRLKAQRNPQRLRNNRSGVPVPTKGNNWWFIRKEELARLIADPEFQRKRSIWKRVNTPEGREAAAMNRYEAEKLSEEDLRAWERLRAFGKPPACEPWRNPPPFDIDWDPRIFWTPPITHDPASPPGFGFTPEDFIDW